MSANRKQPLEAAYFAEFTSTRRRSMPTRPRTPVSMSLHQRWRERPRRRAQRLTQGALTGSFTPSLVVSRVRVCAPRSCGTIAPPACTDQCCGVVERLPRKSVRARARFIGRTWLRLAFRSSRATIARMMLVPCSASSRRGRHCASSGYTSESPGIRSVRSS
jgi:hypothetical protein